MCCSGDSHGNSISAPPKVEKFVVAEVLIELLYEKGGFDANNDVIL